MHPDKNTLSAKTSITSSLEVGQTPLHLERFPGTTAHLGKHFGIIKQIPAEDFGDTGEKVLMFALLT
jgi:hypothetical protein